MSTAKRRRALMDAIGASAAKVQPALQVETFGPGLAVSGTFVVAHDDRPIDSFQVRIELAKQHPAWPPKVFETGERLPRELDRHFFSDGSACLYYPAVYWLQAFHKKPFADFLEGPVRNFFLYQCARMQGVPWRHGELAHGAHGALEFFSDLLGPDTSLSEMHRLLTSAAKQTLSRSSLCPCGRSRGVVSLCHPGLLQLLHEVPASVVDAAASAVRAATRKGCPKTTIGLLHVGPKTC
jgi:hypothetical protein